jgi:hypothetical protein
MNDPIADQLSSAPESKHAAPVLVEMADLMAVATAFCRRAGEPAAEAYRLSTLRDVLDASRALAGALEEFARAGSVHHRGVHCTPNMQAELTRLTERLTRWSDAILTAGSAQREWQLGDTGVPERPRDDLERRLASAYPGLAVEAAAPRQAIPN